MIFTVFFYYENEKTLYYDLNKSKLQNITSKTSSAIIISHMTGSFFDKEDLIKDKSYSMSFYDDNKKKIFGNLDEKIDFNKNIFQKNEYLYLIDSSALGHLGVSYLVIKDNSFFKQKEELKRNIIIIFLSIYSIISLMGFYLAKLFLQPIKDERIKLNNFIKDTTHELNTPITAILMSTQEKSLNEKQIHRIRLSAKRISEIYEDLTYMFLENSHDKRKTQKLSLDKTIEEQLEYFVPLALKKRIKIKYNLEKVSYEMNKDDFIRVFNNLISNAIKYNKVDGKIEIRLSQNTLSIQDTGIGIQKDKIKDIYKRYYRATSQQGGFGIGLNIVSLICEKYDIKLSLNSQINQGSTFTLKF